MSRLQTFACAIQQCNYVVRRWWLWKTPSFGDCLVFLYSKSCALWAQRDVDVEHLAGLCYRCDEPTKNKTGATVFEQTTINRSWGMTREQWHLVENSNGIQFFKKWNIHKENKPFGYWQVEGGGQLHNRRHGAFRLQSAFTLLLFCCSKRYRGGRQKEALMNLRKKGERKL